MSEEKSGSAEYVLFPVARYRSSEGLPVCALNFEQNYVCPLLDHGTRIIEESFCTGIGDLKRLKFDSELQAFPILENCPFWSDKVKQVSCEEAEAISAVSL